MLGSFQLNDQSISTRTDGDFNLMALMDAASCFIFGTMLVPASARALSRLDAKRLLKDGQSQAKQWPQRLIIPANMAAGDLHKEAEWHNVSIEQVSQADLETLIGQARQSFNAYLKGQSAG